MSSYPAQYFGVATPIVNQTNAGVNTLTSQIASGGGGGGGYPSNILASTIAAFSGSIQAMTISSINGAAPGGAIPAAGISTNQVAAVGTDLFLSADNENYIDITGSLSQPEIVMEVPAGNLVMNSQSTISLASFYADNMTTKAINVSSINGAVPGGGGSAPFVSTYSYTTGLTILPNIPDLLFNSGPAPFTLTSGHKYTASWNIAYKNEGAGATPTMALKLDLGNGLVGDPGSIYSAPAYMTSANSPDGALDLFSMTWKQNATDASTNLYVTLVDENPLVNVSTTITNLGNSQYFTLTDWGIVS